MRVDLASPTNPTRLHPPPRCVRILCSYQPALPTQSTSHGPLEHAWMCCLEPHGEGGILDLEYTCPGKKPSLKISRRNFLAGRLESLFSYEMAILMNPDATACPWLQFAIKARTGVYSLFQRLRSHLIPPQAPILRPTDEPSAFSSTGKKIEFPLRPCSLEPLVPRAVLSFDIAPCAGCDLHLSAGYHAGLPVRFEPGYLRWMPQSNSEAERRCS